MKRSGGIGFVILAVFFALWPTFALALQVKSIKSSGVLELEDGRQVHLAGIIVPQESLSSLSVLVSGKDLTFEPEPSPDYRQPQTPHGGYLYVKAFEIDFPFKPQAPPRESTVMVNQLLLSLGMARVDGGKKFKHRDHFLKLEAKARTQGQGIWSYETVPLPAS